jgi:hypothetical protein
MYVEVFWNRVPLIRLPVAHRDADPEIAVKLVTIRAAHCGQQARSASAGTVEPKAIDSQTWHLPSTQLDADTPGKDVQSTPAEASIQNPAPTS